MIERLPKEMESRIGLRIALCPPGRDRMAKTYLGGRRVEAGSGLGLGEVSAFSPEERDKTWARCVQALTNVVLPDWEIKAYRHVVNPTLVNRLRVNYSLVLIGPENSKTQGLGLPTDESLQSVMDEYPW